MASQNLLMKVFIFSLGFRVESAGIDLFLRGMKEYLDNLNGPQREAVINFEGPSLIVAGAGSGKTRVLTTRIAYMLDSGIEPDRVLALTFTNKAAREMRERIATIVGERRSRRLWMGTFHSIFYRILRAEASRLGFPSDFTIYDSADSRNLIKNIIKELDLSDETYKPKDIQARISMAKNNLVTAASYEANTALLTEDRDRKKPQTVEVYKRYVARCKQNGAMDFDDLLLYINILFRDFPDALDRYRNQFTHLLVDEYQDTNYAQYLIVKRLAEGRGNICVVGDDSQSIYSFRGARIENILRFQKDFPAARLFKLERNYRSTQTIVDAANSVIAKNSNRIKKTSFSEGQKGDGIKVLKAYTDQEEASIVADQMRCLSRSGSQWSDIAILYRTNAQSRVLEEALRRRGIPYKIYGGMSFYQRKEIKDLMAYIRLVVNPRDDEALRRIINYPTRGIGDTTLEKITRAAAQRSMSIWETIGSIEPAEADLKGAAANKLREFSSLITSLSLSREQMGLYEFGLEVATRSGIIGIYKMDRFSPEAQSALDNIEELLNSMKSFADDWVREKLETGEEPLPPTISEWLQDVALLTDMDNESAEDRDKVTLMTVHSAKGLEFKNVFVTGMEENLFPGVMSASSADELEEERRLFYVALTRAMERVFLSFSETRFKWGSMEFCRPSRFLGEISGEFLDVDFDLGSGADVPSRVVETKERFMGAGAGQRSERQPEGQAGRRTDYPRRGDIPGHSKPVSPQPVADPRFRSLGTRPQASTQVAAGAEAPVATGDIVVGSRVRHAKFGGGTIEAIEAFGDDQKFVISFDEPVYGKKTILKKFAKLTVI